MSPAAGNPPSERPPYPPPEHALRDIGIVSWLETDDHGFAELPVTDAVLGADGTVLVGALATLVDLACARVSFAAAHPHWIATADMTVTTAAPVTGGTVLAEAWMVKAGSKLMSIAVDLHGAGTASATFVRIPREASDVSAPLAGKGQRVSMERTGPPLTAPVTERMGLRIRDGAAELDRTDYVRNSFGTVNGGVLGFLVAAAAEEASGLTAADLTLRYSGQAKVGPARATGKVVRLGADHAVCDVRVVDAGADDALLVRATVTTVRRRRS